MRRKGGLPKSFYRDFENINRGPRLVVKDRLRVYLDFLDPFKAIYQKEDLNVLDIGCGRGEFVELLTENGFLAKGVDIDEYMLEEAKRLGLDVELSDGLDFLRSMPDSYFIAISAIHVVEHLPIEDMIELIRESKRVLRPAGLLIIETPNPENIKVSTSSFWLDPGHIRPIHAELISFVLDYFSYRRRKILRINEDPTIKNAAKELLDLFVSVSPDYSVIAQKDADKKILTLFDSVFDKEYGISLEQIATDLTSSFDHRFKDLEQRLSEQNSLLDQRISDLTSSFDHRFKDLEQRLSEQMAMVLATRAELGALLYSKPWRYYQFLGRLKRNVCELGRVLATGLLRYAKSDPGLNRMCRSLLGPFRTLKRWLRVRYFFSGSDVLTESYAPTSEQSEADSVNVHLTPRAFRIYMDLKSHITRVRGNSSENIG